MQPSLFRDPTTLVFVAAPTLAILISLNAARLAELLGVMDHPDAERKRHAKATPLIGGIAILVPLFLWCAAAPILGHGVDRQLVLCILLCGAGATLVGFADDQTPMSPLSRLLFLFLLSSIALVFNPDLLPTQISWGQVYIVHLAPWFAFAFVVVALSGFVNAVNMADGQDGIAIGMFVIWALCLTIHASGSAQGVSLILLETALIAFAFNLKGRAFLGDSGSYGVSFVIGILAIQAHNYGGVKAEVITVWFFVPIVDCLRLMTMRLVSGQAPFGSGRDHFHHRLEARVGKTFGLALYLGAIGVASIAATLYPWLSTFAMIALGAFYVTFMRLGQDRAAEILKFLGAKSGVNNSLTANENISPLVVKGTASER